MHFDRWAPVFVDPPPHLVGGCGWRIPTNTPCTVRKSREFRMLLSKPAFMTITDLPCPALNLVNGKCGIVEQCAGDSVSTTRNRLNPAGKYQRDLQFHGMMTQRWVRGHGIRLGKDTRSLRRRAVQTQQRGICVQYRIARAVLSEVWLTLSGGWEGSRN